MYLPVPFAKSDLATLHDFMAAHPLATIVTGSPTQGLYATHLPLVLDRTRGTFGGLQGHIARANPHHLRAADTSEVLVIFSGAEAYITPGWYPSKTRHGKAVPTWNYVAVHATGTIRFTEAREFLMPHLAQLTDTHEAAQAHPWAMSDAPAEYIEQLAKAIVGVEIDILSLEGKWKLSQNRADEDIDGVIHGLHESPHAHHHQVANLVAQHRPNRAE